MDSTERGMIIINPQKEQWPTRSSNEGLPIELWRFGWKKERIWEWLMNTDPGVLNRE